MLYRLWLRSLLKNRLPNVLRTKKVNANTNKKVNAKMLNLAATKRATKQNAKTANAPPLAISKNAQNKVLAKMLLAKMVNAKTAKAAHLKRNSRCCFNEQSLENFSKLFFASLLRIINCLAKTIFLLPKGGVLWIIFIKFVAI